MPKIVQPRFLCPTGQMPVCQGTGMLHQPEKHQQFALFQTAAITMQHLASTLAQLSSLGEDGVA